MNERKNRRDHSTVFRMKLCQKTDRNSASWIPSPVNLRRLTPTPVPQVTATGKQKIYYGVLILFLLFLLKYRWDLFVFLVCGSLMLLYGGAVLMRLAAGICTVCGFGTEKVKQEELDALTDDSLPVYTILLPLYKEPEVAQKILKRIGALDYPASKLDVKLLLESDDAETAAELEKATLPPSFSILRIPDAQPKTKPRACNFGLREAKGEFCVIYDAEDIPDRDQLKKSVVVFRRDKDHRLACVQAKLNYYNSRQNILTGFFTVEYTTYFDLVLAGWQKFNMPLPLGGTSNHFRTEYLRAIGGWDPFNVTEDCELGIRIYENHWKTTVLDSTTLEEANSRLWNWMRQRSRWVKGFIQTHLAHYRNPIATIRRLGLYGALGGYMAVGGSALMMLTNLIYWPLTLLYLFLLIHGWRPRAGKVSIRGWTLRGFTGVYGRCFTQVREKVRSGRWCRRSSAPERFFCFFRIFFWWEFILRRC